MFNVTLKKCDKMNSLWNVRVGWEGSPEQPKLTMGRLYYIHFILWLQTVSWCSWREQVALFSMGIENIIYREKVQHVRTENCPLDWTHTWMERTHFCFIVQSLNQDLPVTNWPTLTALWISVGSMVSGWQTAITHQIHYTTPTWLCDCNTWWNL